MAHCISHAAEEILDKEFKVLDHGFVRLVDYFGNDDRIVQAARVSYGEGTNSASTDAALIDYLLRHKHTSPFEHVVIELHCKMPIFVARQWIRHRTARVNELSGRYSVLKDEAYIPDLHRIQSQSTTNKQGSGDEIHETKQFLVKGMMATDQKNAFNSYHNFLDFGVAREIARINLPLSTYTEWYWQMDLNNLFHFLALRLDSHAQYEIQQFGKIIATIVKAVAPLAYESFERHVVYAKRFSSDEMKIIRDALKNNVIDSESFGSQRLYNEFIDKITI